MKILLLLCLPLYIFAQVHYAKVEPYETIILKSSVTGLVLDVDLDTEGKMITHKRVVHIDDILDKVNLESSIKSLVLVKKMLKINKEIAESLGNTVKRQKAYYRRIDGLSTASTTQKDNAYSSFTSVNTQYLGIHEKIVNLEKQILDLGYKITQQEDIISKKSLIVDNKYIYKLFVRKGDFVVPGASLLEIMDVSRAKLVLFLDFDELKDINQKIVYLNGEKTEYKVNKIWKMTDKKFISSYRAEIYISAPKGSFSKLMKVEIK